VRISAMQFETRFDLTMSLLARCRRMQHRILVGALIAAVAGFAAISPTAAQPASNPASRTMNFDLWCQGEASLPAERCDKHTPEDESAFEAYRTKVERYEIPRSSAQYDQGRVNRDIMNADPVDNPQKGNLGAQQQYPNISATPSQ
jgi:hypothetical protein